MTDKPVDTLILVAKVPGDHSKTRLAPRLGRDGARRLAAAARFESLQRRNYEGLCAYELVEADAVHAAALAKLEAKLGAEIDARQRSLRTRGPH